MPDFIELLRRQLIAEGCPIAKLRRLVREVADHRDDLKQAGMAEGLSEPEAEARAEAALGDPMVVAEQMMATLRRSSWWGRHYVITFGVLPLLAFPILYFSILVLQLLLVSAAGYELDAKKLHTAAGNPYFLAACNGMDWLAIALATSLFCWLARRAVVRLKWLAISCAICSLVATITSASFKTDVFSVGFNLKGHLYMHCFSGLIPVVVAGAAFFLQWRAGRRFQECVQ